VSGATFKLHSYPNSTFSIFFCFVEARLDLAHNYRYINANSLKTLVK